MGPSAGRNAMNLRTRRARILTAGAAAVLLIAGVVWLAWPKGGGEPAPRERTYREFTACLLTDDHGLQGPAAKSVWAGMQQASVANRVKVQYLAVAGAQTAANATPYFNSLAQGCQVVVAV